MRTKLKVILSAVAVAALVGSPAMAKTVRHHRATPSTTSIPSDARASVAPNAAGAPYAAPEGGSYTPSMPAPRGKNHDFQDSPR